MSGDAMPRRAPSKWPASRGGSTASDLARRIGEYMETRNEPWADVALMREAVDEAIKLAIGDAHIDTREALRTTHGF